MGRLGSIGPDLPYYGGLAKTGIKLLFTDTDKPLGIEKWSHQLHSKDPNIFPLKMIEIAWRETDLDAEKWDETAAKQWAFIMGYLSHMAADQIIHPFVNKIAGQYYRSNENRIKHRDCEVYHDVVLYSRKKHENITDAELNTWLDISPEWYKFADTEPYFRIFLQKSFVEAHAVTPEESEIEGWVDGLLLLLRYVDNYGPFVNADKDYQKKGKDSKKYKEFWGNDADASGDYDKYYEEAVKLALIYMKTAFRIFDINIGDFSNKHRQNFLKIVKNTDLTNPLDRGILNETEKLFNDWTS
jgi:hypothetical protein